MLRHGVERAHRVHGRNTPAWMHHHAYYTPPHNALLVAPPLFCQPSSPQNLEPLRAGLSSYLSFAVCGPVLRSPTSFFVCVLSVLLCPSSSRLFSWNTLKLSVNNNVVKRFPWRKKSTTELVMVKFLWFLPRAVEGVW